MGKAKKKMQQGFSAIALQLLHIVEAFVVTVHRNEVIVCAAFNHASFVQDVNLIGILDG